MRYASLLAGIVVSSTISCADGPARTRDTIRLDSTIAVPYRPGVRFDPSIIAPGMRVAGLTVETTAIRPAFDSTLVGVVRFRGELQLSGRTLRHPDPDLSAVCFEADSLSGEQLPRWQGDERRAWFCFTDPTTARRLLAAPGEERNATVVIDSFTIHLGRSDETNSARLVRVVRR